MSTEQTYGDNHILAFVLGLINTMPRNAEKFWFLKKIKEEFSDDKVALNTIAESLSGIASTTSYIAKIKGDPHRIDTIPMSERSREICLIAARGCGIRRLEQIPKELQDAEMCFELVKGNSNLIQEIPEEFKSEKLISLLSNRRNHLSYFKHFPEQFQTEKNLRNILRNLRYIYGYDAIDQLQEDVPARLFNTAVKIWAMLRPTNVWDARGERMHNAIALLDTALKDEIVECLAADVSCGITIGAWRYDGGKFCTDANIRSSLKKNPSLLSDILQTATEFKSKLTQKHYEIAVKAHSGQIVNVPKQFQTADMCHRAKAAGVDDKYLLNEDF
jgi:hypothetical protein